MNIRLNRAIALSGLCSRRAADALIEAGRVCVNGQKPTSCGMSVSQVDCIAVDGKKITLRNYHHYFVFNKPKGYVCSKKRLYKGQKIIYDLIDKPGLFTVGRLDKDTTGLIVLTTDGLLAQEIIHPSKEIEKEYIVLVENHSKQEILELSKGVIIDGVKVRPKSVELMGYNRIKIVVMEGKNREIRRLCKAAKLEVLELQRVRIGRLKLNDLMIGKFIEYKKDDLLRFFDGQKRLSCTQ